ncbi:MAG: homoserine kinase [Chthoniobacterales bacterium]
MEQVTIRVPASTSNLGPGFDCLGVALRIYNQITLQRGRGAPLPPIVRQAADRFCQRAGARPFAFSCRIAGDVPRSRGLGSSAAIRLGVLQALNHFAGQPLVRQEIFELAAALEGHPDNAAPAQFGGFNLVRPSDRQRFSVSAALQFVLLVPDFEVKTSAARALIPPQIDRLGAVASAGNAAAIAAAFASGKYRHLRGAFTDHLHQPFRKKLLPFFDGVVAAAGSAGALGAFLSGSGSTIAAVTLQRAEQIGACMLSAAGGAGRIIITTADNRGARLFHS